MSQQKQNLNEDYYYVLKSKRSATDEEITTGFKKLALLHHPLKNPDNMQIHLDKFHKVCEAYEVLSNRKYNIMCNFRTAQWKAIYDQYGHAILKLGLLDEATGKRFGAYNYRGNCYQIFDWFFLRNNPFYDIADMEGEQPEEGSFMAEAQGLKPELPQMPTIEVEVPTTLQEFYNGCMKVISYEREKIVLDGQTIEMDYCSKNIEVAKGMNDGDVFMYRGEGHQQPGSVPGDIKVTFKHVEPTESSKDFAVTSRYSRKGDDLFYKHPIKLENAIKCLPVKIPLLDGRLVHLALDEIVTPDTVKVISNEGMKHWDKNDPLDKNAKTGNLYVSFDIQFPSAVSTEQKDKIASILQA